LCDNIDPNDIRQGHIGDCWLISAIIALAEKPHLLKKLFVEPKISKNGIYSVRICRAGEWKIVEVDDSVPYKEDNIPYFAFSESGEFWISVLEKVSNLFFKS
jgi:hypothetical protein